MIEKLAHLNRPAIELVQQRLLDERNGASYWEGELSASALSTATAISALSYYQQVLPNNDLAGQISQQVESGLRWLVEMQNQDGGWGDTALSYSNISTSMLVMAALEASESVGQFADENRRVKQYVKLHGGVEAVRKRYGTDKTFAVPILANCAMSGMVDWKEVGVLPFEAACVPQRFYHLLNLPVVSYAVPALVAIGQVKFHFDPPRNPLVRWLRKLSIRRSLNVLRRMQPESGGYLEAIPLTSFVCMALIKSGRPDHPVVQNGISFLMNSFRVKENGRGSWPIDTNLAMWVTTLSINALANDDRFDFHSDPRWSQCRDWILKCQHQEVHPFTGSPPGGWGWSNLTGSVPDADDTPGAMLALRVLRDRGSCSRADRLRIDRAAEQGIRWLLKLQNNDGGWPTFCRGWGRLPFDRSGTDITAHAIRALEVWKGDSSYHAQIESAICRGFNFLEKNQNPDGEWIPLWFGNQDFQDEANPFYGTAKVLLAYHQCKRLHTKSAQNGLEWLRAHQNEDGGWGGSAAVMPANNKSKHRSGVEETALCTEALLLDEEFDSVAAARRGVLWLEQAVTDGVVAECTPIGFYFAKLWYFEKLYPLIYAAAALGLKGHSQTVREHKTGEAI